MPRSSSASIFFRFLFWCTCLAVSSWSFVLIVPSVQRQRQHAPTRIIVLWAKQQQQEIQDDGDDKDSLVDTNNNNKGPLDFVFNPYESKIPKEIQNDIYAAEANTPAAQDRQKRIAGYIFICFLGVLGAFFNAFLSELRMDVSLQEAGFGWVEQSNIVIRFLLLNKIGGGMLLLGGAGAGLLAEAEYDTRRLQAERIFEEMQRRRAQQKKKGGPSSLKKKRKSRENKRLNALAEIVEPVGGSTGSETSKVMETKSSLTTTNDQQKEEKEESKQKEGILGTIQNFYERADSMAASQALLLNKKLEDEGLIEKITDETGLKVIGRDAAQKLFNNEEDAKGNKNGQEKEKKKEEW